MHWSCAAKLYSAAQSDCRTAQRHLRNNQILSFQSLCHAVVNSYLPLHNCGYSVSTTYLTSAFHPDRYKIYTRRTSYICTSDGRLETRLVNCHYGRYCTYTVTPLRCHTIYFNRPNYVGQLTTRICRTTDLVNNNRFHKACKYSPLVVKPLWR